MRAVGARDVRTYARVRERIRKRESRQRGRASPPPSRRWRKIGLRSPIRTDVPPQGRRSEKNQCRQTRTYVFARRSPRALSPSPRACTAKVSKIYRIVLDCLSAFPLSFSRAEKVADKNLNAPLASVERPTRRFLKGGGLLHFSRVRETSLTGRFRASLKNDIKKAENSRGSPSTFFDFLSRLLTSSAERDILSSAVMPGGHQNGGGRFLIPEEVKIFLFAFLALREVITNVHDLGNFFPVLFRLNCGR